MTTINITSEITPEACCDYCTMMFRKGQNVKQIENPWDESLGYMLVDNSCYNAIRSQGQAVKNFEDYMDEQEEASSQ